MIHDSASIGPTMAMNGRDTPKVARHQLMLYFKYKPKQNKRESVYIMIETIATIIAMVVIGALGSASVIMDIAATVCKSRKTSMMIRLVFPVLAEIFVILLLANGYSTIALLSAVSFAIAYTLTKKLAVNRI